jgi:hypothetical protein
MSTAIILLLLLAGCTNEPVFKEKSTARIYEEEKTCREISEFIGKQKFEFTKMNGDWLCLISRVKQMPIAIYDSELEPMRRLIYIKNALSR